MDQPSNAIRTVDVPRTERVGQAPPNFVKVFFEFKDPEWHGPAAEALWAIKVEGKGRGNAYQLQNTPFFAQRVSIEDSSKRNRKRTVPWFSSGCSSISATRPIISSPPKAIAVSRSC